MNDLVLMTGSRIAYDFDYIEAAEFVSNTHPWIQFQEYYLKSIEIKKEQLRGLYSQGT